MLLGLFLRLTLLSVGIDQVIAPAPPSGLNRLPAGSSDNLRSASMQGHQHPPYRASETKPEKGPVPAMQEPATLPHRPRVSSPLSKTAVTPSSTDMTVETLARKKKPIKNGTKNSKPWYIPMMLQNRWWHPSLAQQIETKRNLRRKIFRLHGPTTPILSDDFLSSPSSTDDSIAHDIDIDGVPVSALRLEMMSSLEFSEGMNSFYTTSMRQKKSYFDTLIEWQSLWTNDDEVVIAEFRDLVTQSQVNLMKAMMPEEFSKSIVAASTQHLAWCLDPIQDAYHFWQMATFANWMNGFFLSNWLEARSDKTFHSPIPLDSPVVPSSKSKPETKTSAEDLHDALIFMLNNLASKSLMPVLKFYAAAFPAIVSAVELITQIARVQQLVFASGALHKLVWQAQLKQKNKSHAKPTNHIKAAAESYTESLKYISRFQAKHASQSFLDSHLMQTLSNYAWGITESHGTSIYEAWSQLQKEDLENLQKTADRDAAQSGAQAPVVTAPEVAEESGSTPASEEAELLHKILRHIRLDTVVTPTPAMLEDPNGDFLEFYDALLAVYTHLYQTSPISISDPINNAHEAFNEVWKLEEFKPIVEDLDMGQLEQIMEEKLRNLDEAARKFLPSDFRSSKPEDGDGRFPLLPSKIFGQVMDLFQFVDGVAQLWQQATTPSQILTFFSNADVYRQTMNVSHRLGQYRVLNQYLRLSSQNN